ncbi:MAG TPA: hypothetical protein VHR45_11100 [Thermoanaerobaculia bacterium]|nr:hypothetical protein [Thermoanaerobaculia bacterium]
MVELVALPGNWPAVLTWINARYDDAHYQGAYREVAIECGREVLAVTPINEVH